MYQLTASEIQKLLAKKEIKALEVLEAFNTRIDQVDEKIQALLMKTYDLAKEQAQIIDEKIARGEELAPLAGVPIVIKDNIALEGLPLTCGSKALAGYISPYGATVNKRLDKAGALFIAKTNMDEFAMGSSSENSALFTTKNPHNLEHSPGGSSGGTAAALASGQAPIGLGSDTGGSVRQPAAFCGITALKPTYGRISRYGLVGFASSLDQIGPMARSTEDLARLLEVLAGHDPQDPTSSKIPPVKYSQALEKGVEGLCIGLPKECFSEEVDGKIKEQIEGLTKELIKRGAQVEECSLPSIEHSLAIYQIISSAEGSSNLARIDGVRYGYREPSKLGWEEMMEVTRGSSLGFEVKRRMLLGAYVLEDEQYQEYFLKAQKVRVLITREFQELFKNYQALITPTTTTAAFKLGNDMANCTNIYRSDILTTPVNLAGLPALSLPCGKSADNLPYGVQLISNYFAEDYLFQIAQVIEELVGWPKEPVEL